MKKELVMNGPISCGIDVTDGFEAYVAGTIYSEEKKFPMINHELSIVGYGVDEVSGKEFWIGRNSWGTYWGDRGYFMILMHENNLSIEKDCTAGIPSFSPNADANPELFTQ
jgi:cathepsin X